MSIRTDLALESAGEKIFDGITKTQRGKAFKITEIAIIDDKSGEKIGRKKGKYITLEGSSFGGYSNEFRNMCQEFSEELSPFLPNGNILVVGLGNSDITPDALGPQVAAKILATRHLRDELESSEEFFSDLRSVGVIAGGVLGQTGIETAELIDAVMEKVKPECVIAVDALACSDVNRLGCTVQLSDAGISPGSGVQNKRKELSEKTLGVPVIAIGIPTVVDMHTIVSNYTGSEISGNLPNMMVTPRDVDKLIERSASMLAAGINMALQPQLDFDQIETLMW